MCEITNVRIIEAKQDNRWIAVRLLWSNPTGSFGSAVTHRADEEQSFDLTVTRFEVG